MPNVLPIFAELSYAPQADNRDAGAVLSRRGDWLGSYVVVNRWRNGRATAYAVRAMIDGVAYQGKATSRTITLWPVKEQAR